MLVLAPGITIEGGFLRTGSRAMAGQRTFVQSTFCRAQERRCCRFRPGGGNESWQRIFGVTQCVAMSMGKVTPLAGKAWAAFNLHLDVLLH
jgi:hypothetical protein